MGLVLGAGDDSDNRRDVDLSEVRGIEQRLLDYMPEVRIDVLPTTLADLQAQGRTPAVPTPEPNYAGESGAMDGVVAELQAPLEPEYGGLGRTAELICAYPWPQGCDYWVEVARCESSLRPYAIGYAGAYVGLFQVWTGHGYAYDWLLDPANNTLAAWELSHEGTRTSPWPYCQWR